MATKTPNQPKTAKVTKTSKPTKPIEGKPIVTIGSHSTRTQFANGKVHFVVDDEKLRMDVFRALESYASGK